MNDDQLLATYALERFARQFDDVAKVLLLGRACLGVWPHLPEGLDKRDPKLAALLAEVYRRLVQSERKQVNQGWMELTTGRLMIAAAADGLQTYVVSALGDLYWSNPALLPSAAVANELLILEGEARTDVIVKATHDEVDDMSYKPFDKLLERVRALGAAVWLSSDELRDARLSIEYRHIIVHHSCCASKRFLEHTGRSDLKHGQEVRFTFAEASVLANAVLLAGARIDQGLVRKFGPAVFGPRTGKAPESRISDERLKQVIEDIERRYREGDNGLVADTGDGQGANG